MCVSTYVYFAGHTYESFDPRVFRVWTGSSEVGPFPCLRSFCATVRRCVCASYAGASSFLGLFSTEMSTHELATSGYKHPLNSPMHSHTRTNRAKVEDLIKQLGLTRCADNIVGMGKKSRKARFSHSLLFWSVCLRARFARAYMNVSFPLQIPFSLSLWQAKKNDSRTVVLAAGSLNLTEIVLAQRYI